MLGTELVHECRVHLLLPSASSFIVSRAWALSQGRQEAFRHAESVEIFGGRDRNGKQAGKLSSFLVFPPSHCH